MFDSAKETKQLKKDNMNFKPTYVQGRANRTKIVPQHFDYFLVMDFEATCQKNEKIEPQEIIEFPCLKVSGVDFQVESEFHRYVRPVHHPILTPFCTDLTGINQDRVDGEADFAGVFADFQTWLQSEQLLDKKITFVTCGDWDLRTMLPAQCATTEVPVPEYFNQWINLKKSHHRVMRKFPRHLKEMLNGVGLQFQGRPHSGIDDTRNIARVLHALAEKSFVFENTSSKI